MNPKELVERTIQKLPERAQKLGVPLCRHIVEPQDMELLSVLKTYQNDDGGFGNGLEADIQLPQSNVASSDVAVSILEEIADSNEKQEMIKQLVRYYENVYDETTYSVEIVPKEVDLFPHAVWWNYDSISSFTYGNPNPEVAGFLLQHRHYITKIDIDAFVDHVVQYIVDVLPQEVKMHNLLSSLLFYKRVPESIRSEIQSTLQELVQREVELDEEKWEEYSLEPIKVAMIDDQFLQYCPDALAKNIAKYEKILEADVIRPNWQWFQYDDVFTVVKDDWVPLLTWDALKAIIKYRKR